MSISRALPRAAAVATTAAVLPVAVLIAPAAAAPPGDKPAGKPTAQADGEPRGKGVGSQQPIDRSGSSDNPDGTFQGKSGSTPDQDGTGADNGADNNDKTGPGTDGNNGCGNEPRDSAATVDDDNNGRCLGLTKTRADADAPPTGGAVLAHGQPVPSVAAPVETTPTAVLSGGLVAPVTDRPAAPVDGRSESVDVLSAAFGAQPAVVDAAAMPAWLESGVASQAVASPTTLPFTGADTVVLAALAVGGIAAGSTLLLVARRRPDSDRALAS
ncbi:MAG: hypothetical protein ACLGIG_02065 [Actinomycetes bacterium]